MTPRNLFLPRCAPALAIALLAALLSACGGGSGGGGGGSSSSATAAPVAIRSLASLSSSDVPTQWPQSFRTATVTKAQLVSNTQLAQTSNPASQIFAQVWYLDQTGQRQTLAMLTIAALDGMGGSLNLTQIPSAVSVLHSQVYTANGTVQQTLANQDLPL